MSDPNSPSGTGEIFNSYIGSGCNSAFGAYSHAEGYKTTASGSFSHAEGHFTQANGGYSHAEGYWTVANENYSHAEGYYTSANGDSSHAEGLRTNAKDYYSHAEGNSTKANGYTSHAEGYGTDANGSYSHAEGFKTQANGYVSHAEGYETSAIGSFSHAEGSRTTASGEASHAEGHYSIANGKASHAEGSGTTASGEASHAEGSYSIANGKASHAEGQGTIATNLAEHAQGIYNVSHSGVASSAQTIHSIGIGSSSTNRKNAIEVMENGIIYLNGIGGYSGNTIRSTYTYPIQDCVYDFPEFEIIQAEERTTDQHTNITAYTESGFTLYDRDIVLKFRGRYPSDDCSLVFYTYKNNLGKKYRHCIEIPITACTREDASGQEHWENGNLSFIVPLTLMELFSCRFFPLKNAAYSYNYAHSERDNLGKDWCIALALTNLNAVEKTVGTIWDSSGSRLHNRLRGFGANLSRYHIRGSFGVRLKKGNVFSEMKKFKISIPSTDPSTSKHYSSSDKYRRFSIGI